jgi:hypothetical protein
MDTNKKPKKSQEYNCEKCKFITKHKNDYNKHLLTTKHMKGTNIIQCTQIAKKMLFICKCGKEYKYSQGLSRHKQTCNNPIQEPIIERIQEPTIEPVQQPNITMIIEIIKENQEFKKLLLEQTIKVSEQNNQVIELYKENNILNKENNILNKENNKLINKLVEKSF